MGGGLVLDCVLLAYDLYAWAAEEQAAANLFEVNDTYARARGYEPSYCVPPVDADLCMKAFWILKDAQNNLNHMLRIWSELWWEEFDIYGTPIRGGILRSFVDLKLFRDTNDNRESANRVTSGDYNRLYIGAYDQSDWYKVNVNQGYLVCATASAMSGTTDVYVAIHDPQGNFRKGSASHGTYFSISYVADSTGDWFIHVWPYSNTYGFYKLSVSVLPNEGSGCPTLFVWNGTHFCDEGVLNIHSEPNCDVIVQQTLKTPPIRQNLMYTLKLAEIAYGYNFSHSYIDQVKLYAIDNVGKTYECYLVYANHSTQGNVLYQLWLSDDVRVETFKDENIDLKFLAPIFARNINHFIFEIEGHNPLKI
jgi:hypothetical protein